MKLQRKQDGTKREGYYLLQVAIWVIILFLIWIAFTKFNIEINY